MKKIEKSSNERIKKIMMVIVEQSLAALGLLNIIGFYDYDYMSAVV